MFIVFDSDISLILRTREISLHKNNSHDLHRVITHALVLVILFMIDCSLQSLDIVNTLANEAASGIRASHLRGFHESRLHIA